MNSLRKSSLFMPRDFFIAAEAALVSVVAVVVVTLLTKILTSLSEMDIQHRILRLCVVARHDFRTYFPGCRAVTAGWGPSRKLLLRQLSPPLVTVGKTLLAAARCDIERLHGDVLAG